jgi:hypothetical protein
MGNKAFYSTIAREQPCFYASGQVRLDGNAVTWLYYITQTSELLNQRLDRFLNCGPFVCLHLLRYITMCFLHNLAVTFVIND